jgi:ABC-2 type transport system permease protein
MIRPVLLIAEREFRTYVVTLSFWLSLAVMPLAGGILLLLSIGPAVQTTISVSGADARMVHSARQALQEAGQIEGRPLAVGQGRDTLAIVTPTRGVVEIRFSKDFPLSPSGRALIARSLERDVARDRAPAKPIVVRETLDDTASDIDRLSGLAATMMLWLTLVGSLGMLLQAVVRERANRALESLLAAARAWEIVGGKMLGVGMVSLLILCCWLGSTFAYSFLLPPEAGLVPAILAKLAEPLTLLRAASIYVCAFAFYGAITVALGATARDSAAAQNLVRPMFVLLLAAFFVVLAGSGAPNGLIFVPPFTPFLLLTAAAGTIAPFSQIGLLCMLLAFAVLTVLLAARLLCVAPQAFYIPFLKRRGPQPVV